MTNYKTDTFEQQSKSQSGGGRGWNEQNVFFNLYDYMPRRNLHQIKRKPVLYIVTYIGIL